VALTVLVGAGLVSATGIEPTPHALASYWFVGTAPWLVLLIFGGRLREVVVIVVGHHVVAILRMLVLPVDGLAIGYLPGMVTSAGYALAIAVATWLLASLAGQAARRRREDEEISISDQFAREAHESRRQRYVEIATTAGPLLEGLANWTLDPQDPVVRRRCAIEAARMRRLFAESDEVPDSLLHELRACADLADRRGVMVTLATSGSWPELPKAARRNLTEGPLMVLATAGSQARVTVAGTHEALSVSVVADCPDLEIPQLSDQKVCLTAMRRDEMLWVEARWDANEWSR
jgi:hypothetical protein